uniref:Transcription initiation factor IIF subunit alpha n=1 Tax=Glossina pallidipes TaxID=7398 RepID=A0A1A9ZJM0_GLOPL
MPILILPTYYYRLKIRVQCHLNCRKLDPYHHMRAIACSSLEGFQSGSNHHVMRFNATRSVDLAQWRTVKLERENNLKEFTEEDVPKFGAGSKYNRDLHFGYPVVLLGRYNGQDLGANYVLLFRTTPGSEYIKVLLQNGRLRGAILVGNTELAESCENRILNGIDLTPFGDDILNPAIDIEDYFD